LSSAKADRAADHQAEDDQHDAQQERHTPGPVEQVLLGQRRNTQEDQVGQQQPGRRAHLRPAAVEAATVGGRVLDGEQHGRAPFAAQSDALAQTQPDQQGRRQRADLVVGRQETDQDSRSAHHQQSHNEH
jgi:hypothetical protein